MFRLFILLLILCNGIGVSCQINDISIDVASGSIKSIRETVYSIPSNGEAVNSEILSDAKHTYNSLGKKTETINLRNDTVFSIVRYQLKEDSILIESNEYNSDGTLYLKVRYSTDDNGYIEKAVYERDNQKAYDDERHRIDVEYEKFYSKLFTSIDYVVDFKGNIVRSKYTNDNGSLYCRYMHNYDYKYNRVQTKYYNNKNKLSWRKKMKYDRDGLPLETKLYESNRLARTSEFSHITDEKGNWIERKEVRQLFDNFFAYYLDDNTIIIKREIEYFE